MSITQYLFFKLNNQSYAIKANIVKEIVDYIEVTTVPKANKAIQGITNIRGDIVPIVDPKVLFGMEDRGIGKRTSFIILNIYNEIKQTNSHIALIVDLVNEVDDIKGEDILKTPEFGTTIDAKYIENMIRYEHEDDYVIALNVDTVINIQELAKV